jgi:hypothetical protein
MMRACFVAGRAAGFDDAGAGRLWDLDLLDFRAVERVAALSLDLGLVMGSSEVHAAPSAAPPQPRPSKNPAGQDPEAASAAPSHHSNAPIRQESQSILSKIIALMPRCAAHNAVMALEKGLDESNALYEARRRLSCGNCFGCDNCYGVCRR